MRRTKANDFFDTYYEQAYEQIYASKMYVGTPQDNMQMPARKYDKQTRSERYEYQREYALAHRYDMCECGNQKKKQSKRCRACFLQDKQGAHSAPSSI